MPRIWKYASFGAMAVLILAMTAATVLEKFYGTGFSLRWFYHSPWFIVLWAVAAVCGVVWLVKRGLLKKVFTMSLHLSFVLILAGALVTFLTGGKGRMHLKVGETGHSVVLENGTVEELPFSLRLERFSISFYPGTQSPEDYTSALTVLPEGLGRTVSMNHILKYKGYRFYQADYDRDGEGSTLAVSHDPWGIGLTYTGYLLLALSMLGFFFQKGTRFRAALKRLLPMAVLILGLIQTQPSLAKQPGPTPKVLPKEVAAEFGDLSVYYNGRICPFSTMCRDYCLKAYGKAGWNGFTPEQVMTGWLFYYDWWRVVPFKVKAKERGTSRESEKEYLQRSVASGDALKLYPIPDSEGNLGWYGCNDELPPEVLDDYDLWVFVRKVMDLVNESVRAEDWPEVLRLVGKIKTWQEKSAGAVLPATAKVRAEQFWGRISRPMVPFMASITLGILLFILSGILLVRKKNFPACLSHILAALTLLLWIYLSVTIGLGWYISGHGPFAGSYNVMMLMAWLTCLGMLLGYRRFPLILPLGFILAGFTMLQASLAGGNPQITHLMPVLQSPLLSIHVLSMMISYTLFGLIALNGLMGLLVPDPASKAHLQDISLVILYPAVFVLAFGTFLGAVWANISWGSYWSWDPKETWALITLLVYSMALHSGSISAFRHPKFFHWYTVLALMTVIITYFGVNFLFGGMHAYA